MLVKEVLPIAHDRLQWIKQESTLLQAARLLDAGHDMLVVCDYTGRLAGVITKTDVVRQTGHCCGSSCTAQVTQAMTREVITAQPDNQLQDIWEVMNARGYKNIPILDLERIPVGVLNARDVFQTLIQETQYENKLLFDYVMNVGYR